MIEFYKSKNILIQGVTLKNSPFWFVHPVLSINITVDGIHINSKGPNTDGFDPESSSYILVENSVFNDGDDCIAIKSGRNNDGRRINVPSTNIVIRNDKMNAGYGGVVIGSEVTGGAWNIFVEDDEMSGPNLNMAFRVKSNSKRGGIIKNIFLRNIQIGQVNEAIVKLNMNYDPQEAKGYRYYPVIKNIHIENVTSHKSKHALFFDGLPGSKIRDIYISDSKFDGVSNGNKLINTADIKLNKVYINGKLIK